MERTSAERCPGRTTSVTGSVTISGGQSAAALSYLLEGPPKGGPSCVLDPEGRIRTGICLMDSQLLYQLSYLGVVPQMYRRNRRGARWPFRPLPELATHG